jgi:DNA-binding response OmpR family regulator
MSDKLAKPTREERLAAKLRENLRRRKQQARESAPQDLSKPPPPG